MREFGRGEACDEAPVEHCDAVVREAPIAERDPDPGDVGKRLRAWLGGSDQDAVGGRIDGEVAEEAVDAGAAAGRDLGGEEPVAPLLHERCQVWRVVGSDARRRGEEAALRLRGSELQDDELALRSAILGLRNPALHRGCGHDAGLVVVEVGRRPDRSKWAFGRGSAALFSAAARVVGGACVVGPVGFRLPAIGTASGVCSLRVGAICTAQQRALIPLRWLRAGC